MNQRMHEVKIMAKKVLSTTLAAATVSTMALSMSACRKDPEPDATDRLTDSTTASPSEQDPSSMQVKLDQQKMVFFVGDKLQLTAQAVSDAAGGQKIYFYSTNDAIVLSEPVFTKETGQSAVTVSAVNNASGSIVAVTEDGSATAVCQVTVGEVLEESAMVNRAVGGSYSVDKNDSNANEDISKAFDNSTSTKWLALNTASASITYQFADGNRYFITKYALVSANDDPDRDPKAWSLSGSNDGEHWDLLDQRENEVFYGRKLKRIFTFSPEKAYAYYRLDITANSGDAHTQLSEIQLFECGDLPSWGMGPFVKQDAHNPILVPNTTDSFFDPVRQQEILWTDLSLYNPTAIVKDDVIHLLYRAQDATDKKTSRVGLATSTNGLDFTRRDTPVIYPDNTYNEYEWGGGCEDPRVVEGPDGKYYLYYTGYNGVIARLMVASSDDLIHWEKHGLVFKDAYNGKYAGTWSKSGSVITEIKDGKQVAKRMDDGKFWMYWGESDFFMASSDDLIHWTPLEDENGKLVSVMKPRKGMYDSYLVEPGPAALYTEDGIFMLYNCANDNPSGNGDPMLANRAYCPGQVVFDPHDPTKVIHRTQSYFLYPEEDYELEGLVNNVCFVEGMIYYHDLWYIYYGTADSRLAVATWDPSAKPPQAKPVQMDQNTLTLQTGVSGELSVSGDGELCFISTNPEITVSKTAVDPDSGKVTVTLSARKVCTGILVAYNRLTHEADTCTVTVTAPFSVDGVRFLCGAEEITAITAGDIGLELDLTGYSDAEVSLTPVIEVYWDGKLLDSTAETQTVQIQANRTVTVKTPKISVPAGKDMTLYRLKACLLDENGTPLIEETELAPWSPPNLALGKTVKASSVEGTEVAAKYAVDGDFETRWASSGSNNQWLMIDLGEKLEFDQITLYWETAYSNRYRIEVSSTGTADADFTVIKQVKGAGGQETLDFDPVSARYVRIHCETRASDRGNSLWEVEIRNSASVGDR